MVSRGAHPNNDLSWMEAITTDHTTRTGWGFASAARSETIAERGGGGASSTASLGTAPPTATERGGAHSSAQGKATTTTTTTTEITWHG